MGLVLIVLEQLQQKMSLDKERHLGILLNGPVSTYIRQTPKRGWLVSPKRQNGKTLFLKKILRPEGYVHRSNSLDPISQPAAQLVVILPHIFALGVL